jgi:hypothetical protein
VATRNSLGCLIAFAVFAEDGVGDPAWGDHLRIWCDADRALATRTALDELSRQSGEDEGYLQGKRLAWCDEKGVVGLAA